MLFWSICLVTMAQSPGVAIAETETTPNASAILDVSSSSKGVLIPRLTSTQRQAISAPATGLLVFDDTQKAFYFYSGAAWSKIGTDDWSIDGSDVYYNGGNVGIGTPEPAAALDVTSTTGGFLPPRMTTTQRDNLSNPVAGTTIYNTTTSKLQCFNGTIWNDLY